MESKISRRDSVLSQKDDGKETVAAGSLQVFDERLSDLEIEVKHKVENIHELIQGEQKN